MQEMWVYAGAQGMVNATAVPLANGKLLVVDTGGNPADGEFFAQQVAKMGEVVLVFNTHEHGDHTQGNRFFSCPIISSIPARQVMAQAPGADAKSLPHVAFSDRMELTLGEPLIMQLMGGHCPGLSALYLPERKLLFTGDLVFNGRMPWMGQADFHKWINNLDELLSWNADTVVPGHGPVGGKEILEAQRDFLVNFLQEVKQAEQHGLDNAAIFTRFLTKNPVQERWQEMLRRAIELAIQA